jgi:hypothetical protein
MGENLHPPGGKPRAIRVIPRHPRLKILDDEVEHHLAHVL